MSGRIKSENPNQRFGNKVRGWFNIGSFDLKLQISDARHVRFERVCDDRR